MAAIRLSLASRRLAGVLLLSIVGVEFGGRFMTTVVQGEVELTEFQQSFFRAGHAHAGVLLILGLVCLLYADVADVRGTLGWVTRLGVPVAAIFMPAGFFLSALGTGVTEANGLIVLLYLGGLSLAAGVVSLGIGLLKPADKLVTTGS
ncbi:hypothetical protein ALI22I_27555 [Saccharothrix sp. ALI-22-I]|uniref:hypothetical protein n=1 Tax=Saccharothrix sp. ALI-22-I TaxID=1933778 RepID=UPI00097C8DA4|nr:hypothetical protein [Saccharothrix sp. ALI-22-I]ONI85551.1 hypothetical protein ALI22I_27555 [Saccharothrix sp. ALI-22-I]